MSYTNQEILWTKILSQPNQSLYGDVEYEETVNLKARKQPKEELIRRADGTDVLSKSVYYISPIDFPQALQIQRLDKLDNELVEAIYIMVTLQGNPKMIRVYTS